MRNSIGCPPIRSDMSGTASSSHNQASPPHGRRASAPLLIHSSGSSETPHPHSSLPTSDLVASCELPESDLFRVAVTMSNPPEEICRHRAESAAAHGIGADIPRPRCNSSRKVHDSITVRPQALRLGSPGARFIGQTEPPSGSPLPVGRKWRSRSAGGGTLAQRDRRTRKLVMGVRQCQSTWSDHTSLELWVYFGWGGIPGLLGLWANRSQVPIPAPPGAAPKLESGMTTSEAETHRQVVPHYLRCTTLELFATQGPTSDTSLLMTCKMLARTTG